MKLFLCLVFLILGFAVDAQTPSLNPFQNQVILKHYSVQDLQAMQQADTLKFKTICYYYTQSFSFKSKKCDGCPPVTVDMFDVSEYEYMRKKDKRFTRHFEKYGFEITFLAIDELQYKLPIHNQ